MGDSLLTSLGAGVALTGVLLVAGVAAAAVGRGLPHLGLGALAPAAAVAATRAASLGRIGAILVALVAGAVLGAGAWALDRRAQTAPAGGLALLGDAAVLGLALAFAVIARPAVFIELPLGPLGGVPTTVQGVLAGVLGAAGATAVAFLRRSDRKLAVWIIAASAGAVAVLLGSGALSLLAAAATPVFTIADCVGIAVRAAGVGLMARFGWVWVTVAAVVLGMGEAAARATGLEVLPVVPAVLVLGAGLVVVMRSRPVPNPA